MFAKRKARVAAEVKAAALVQVREIYLASIEAQTDETVLLILRGRRANFPRHLREMADMYESYRGLSHYDGFVPLSPKFARELADALENPL